MNEHQEQELAGCCGLYCGLCPRYQSKAPSRCLSCHLGEQHNYCSVWRCCVGKRGHHTCADCPEYPCERLIRVLGVEQEVDSFISHKPALPNLERIREVGMATFLEEQRERLHLLAALLDGYNEGRSMSFYCRATALMPPELVRQAIDAADRERGAEEVADSDLKARAKAMRGSIQELAGQAGIDISLRKGKK
jgi:hypothetical protein